MAKVVPNSVFNPVCVIGVDVNGDFRVLTVATDGTLQIAGKQVTGAEIPIAFYDGAAFRAAKSDNAGRLYVRGMDQLFSFKDTLYEYVADLNADAGWDILLGSVVPSGEIWVVTGAVAYDTTSDITWIAIGAYIAGTNYFSAFHMPTAAWDACQFSGHIYLKAGDRLAAEFLGTVAGDDIWLRYVGYKMTKLA